MSIFSPLVRWRVKTIADALSGVQRFGVTEGCCVVLVTRWATVLRMELLGLVASLIMVHVYRLALRRFKDGSARCPSCVDASMWPACHLHPRMDGECLPPLDGMILLDVGCAWNPSADVSGGVGVQLLPRSDPVVQFVAARAGLVSELVSDCSYSAIIVTLSADVWTLLRWIWEESL